LESVNYLHFSKGTSPDAVTSLTNLPTWWTEYYLSAERVSRNPFIHTCHSFDMSLICQEFLDRHPHLNPKEVDFINEHSETGFVSGLAVPVALIKDGHCGGWKFGSDMKAGKFEALFHEVGSKAQVMGLYAHQRIQALLRQNDACDAQAAVYGSELLSAREKLCLYYLAHGKKAVQIADLLNVRPVTIEFHFKNARQKLQAATREEALAKAIVHRLIAVG
jgi:DNA-binding CsgD family transcriptional regulator